MEHLWTRWDSERCHGDSGQGHAKARQAAAAALPGHHSVSGLIRNTRILRTMVSGIPPYVLGL